MKQTTSSVANLNVKQIGMKEEEWNRYMFLEDLCKALQNDPRYNQYVSGLKEIIGNAKKAIVRGRLGEGVSWSERLRLHDSIKRKDEIIRSLTLKNEALSITLRTYIGETPTGDHIIVTPPVDENGLNEEMKIPEPDE